MMLVTFILFCTFLVVTGAKVSNSSRLDGKIGNARIATTSVSLAVVSIKLNGEHLCSGCYISSDYFITSYMCSRKFYSKLYDHDIAWIHIDARLRAFSGNEGRQIQEAFRLYSNMDNFLLFDIALAKVRQSFYNINPVIHMRFSDVIIRSDLELQIYGWDNILGECYDSNVTVADVNALNYIECKAHFNPLVMDNNINKCARAKNNAKISLMDAGSPMVIDNRLAGIVTHISGVSGKYILFVPAANIKRYWRMSTHANILRQIEANYAE